MRQLTVLITAVLALSSSVADAMRCGNKLVLEGMTRLEVRKRCGDPDDSSRRFETIYRRNSRDEAVAIEIEIDEWIYDLGSNTLDRRLIFVNGRLQREELAD